MEGLSEIDLMAIRQYQAIASSYGASVEEVEADHDERPAADEEAVVNEETLAAIRAVVAAHLPAEETEEVEEVNEEIARIGMGDEDHWENGGRHRKTEGQSFPYKLWHMCSDNTFYDVCHFSLDGNRIVFPDEDEFTDRVLARKEDKIFKTENLKSFHRQLNLYGFIKIQLKRENCYEFLHLEERIKWPDMVFEHPFFKKDRLDLLENLKRRCNIRPVKLEGNGSKEPVDDTLYTNEAKFLMEFPLHNSASSAPQNTKRKLFGSEKQRKNSKRKSAPPAAPQTHAQNPVDMTSMYQQYQWPAIPWSYMPQMIPGYYNATNHPQGIHVPFAGPQSIGSWASPTPSYQQAVSAAAPPPPGLPHGAAFLQPMPMPFMSGYATATDQQAAIPWNTFAYGIPPPVQQVEMKRETCEGDEKPATVTYTEEEAPMHGAEEEVLTQVRDDETPPSSQLQPTQSQGTSAMDGIEPLPSSSESRISSDCGGGGGGGKVSGLFSPLEEIFQPYLASSPS